MEDKISTLLRHSISALLCYFSQKVKRAKSEILPESNFFANRWTLNSKVLYFHFSGL